MTILDDLKASGPPYMDLLIDALLADIPGTAFGSMTADPAGTVTINTQDVWEEVLSGFIVGEVDGVTFGGNHYLEVGTAGKYRVNVTATLTSANNEVVGVACAVNGTEHTAGHGHSTIPGPGDSAAMSQSVILDLSAGDQVSVAVVNHGSASNLDVIHCGVTVALL